jgi:hypothetical protein
LPILEAQLCAEDQRRLQDVEQRQLKRLRRAFLAVRKRAPEFEFFDVSAGHGKGQEPPAVADATEPPAGQALGEQPVQAGATESNNGDVGHDVDVDVGVDGGLFVVEAFEEKLYLASRNLPRVEVLEATALDPVSLLRHERVVVTVAALRRIEENLA